jgi:excisionase family DNA binding protein
MHEDWLTLTQAAERLGVTTQTARRWVRDGKLPAERTGGPHGMEYRVRAADLPLGATDVASLKDDGEPAESGAAPLARDAAIRERQGEPDEPVDGEPAGASRSQGVAAPSAMSVDEYRAAGSRPLGNPGWEGRLASAHGANQNRPAPEPPDSAAVDQPATASDAWRSEIPAVSDRTGAAQPEGAARAAQPAAPDLPLTEPADADAAPVGSVGEASPTADNGTPAEGASTPIRLSVRLDDPTLVDPLVHGGDLARALEALRAEVRQATREQAAREWALRHELGQMRGELAAAHEALRQARETIADLQRQLDDRDQALERRTRALQQAQRRAEERESGRLSVLRESLEEGSRPWWRRLKGEDKK